MVFRKRISETYTLESDKGPFDDFISDLESEVNQSVYCDVCHFTNVDVPRFSSPLGREGNFVRYSKATLYSDDDTINLNLNGSFRNPGARFQGEAGLTLTYLEGCNQIDLAPPGSHRRDIR